MTDSILIHNPAFAVRVVTANMLHSPSYNDSAEECAGLLVEALFLHPECAGTNTINWRYVLNLP